VTELLVPFTKLPKARRRAIQEETNALEQTCFIQLKTKVIHYCTQQIGQDLSGNGVHEQITAKNG